MSESRPVRMLLATLGSRGDVEPFLCLARAAQEAGHQVRVAVPDSVEIDTRGLDAVSLGISFADLAESLGGGGLAAMRTFRERIRPAMSRALATAADVAVEWEPQVILAHPKVLTAPVAAAKLGVPWLAAELTPTLTPTREFPAAGIAARSLGSSAEQAQLPDRGSGRCDVRQRHQGGPEAAGDHRGAAATTCSHTCSVQPHSRAPPRGLAGQHPAHG